jgi:hypothetical protein
MWIEFGCVMARIIICRFLFDLHYVHLRHYVGSFKADFSKQNCLWC